MIKVHPEYIVDKEKKPRAVIISFSEWNKILEHLEELDDIQAYEKAKSSDQEKIPFEQAVEEIRKRYES